MSVVHFDQASALTATALPSAAFVAARNGMCGRQLGEGQRVVAGAGVHELRGGVGGARVPAAGGLRFLAPGRLGPWTDCRTAPEPAPRTLHRLARDEALHVLGWRELPVDASPLGAGALGTMPRFAQVFIGPDDPDITGRELDRRLYILRKRIEHELPVYLPSLSSRTLVYKGMLMAHQIIPFYPDLKEEDLASAIAVVHQRYSTNTFPTWDLAQPFRYLCHNGEINTLRRNINNMQARETTISTTAFGEELSKLFPVVNPLGSDSAIFDNVFELLSRAGRDIEHVMMMMIPEPWSNHESMPDDKKAFYEYHSMHMEPWDGPAGIVLTDGRHAACVLDRNGLRPARYVVTDDRHITLASEIGVYDYDPADVERKETALHHVLMGAPDAIEGGVAYVERRKPEFKG